MSEESPKEDIEDYLGWVLQPGQEWVTDASGKRTGLNDPKDGFISIEKLNELNQKKDQVE